MNQKPEFGVQPYQRHSQASTERTGPANNFGNLYKNQGKLQEAEGMHWRVLGGKEKALGPNHTSTLKIVNNLGILYKDPGKLKEVEEMYRRALAAYERVLGPHHRRIWRVVDRLSALRLQR